MADKTTGELRAVNIGDLPGSADIYDDFKMPGEHQGEAVHVTGAQLKVYAQESTRQYANSAEASASSAASSAATAKSAFEGVTEALNNLPAGATVVINNLTTGGTSAALSAEMGKQLDQTKLSKTGGTLTGNLDVKNRITFGKGQLTEYNGGEATFRIVDRTSQSSYRYISLTDQTKTASRADALSFVEYDGTGYTINKILHTGNKTSGSYTGGGNKTVNTGGFGSAVLIYNAYGIGIITEHGGFMIALQGNTAGTVTPYLAAEAKFAGGVITIATDSIWINASGATYIYQVL